MLYAVYVQLDAESCHEFEKQSENKFNDKSQKEYAHTPKNESDDEFESSPIDATCTYCLECKLTDQIGGVDFLAFAPPLCECYFNGGSSKQVWIRYYPKVALKKKYLSNEWGHLTASFKGYHSGIPLKVKECGVHLIYAWSDQHDNLLAKSLDHEGPIGVESDSFEVGQQPCLEGWEDPPMTMVKLLLLKSSQNSSRLIGKFSPLLVKFMQQKDWSSFYSLLDFPNIFLSFSFLDVKN